MNVIKAKRQSGVDYQNIIPTVHWDSVDFPGARFGHVTPNIAESMNQWINKVRNKVISI